MTTRAAKLVVLATPIGNLSDLSNRVIYTLRDLKYFFVEDTRELTKLMSAYDISHIGKEIFSYARHNMKGANERALELLKAGESVGMLCDRGTPCISDPGFLLVRAARSLGFAVIPIPGCSSIIAALSVSGLPSDKFLFLGFLPKEPGKMQAVLDEMVRAPYTIGFFESPHGSVGRLHSLKSYFQKECYLLQER